MDTIDPSTLGTPKKGIETSTAPPPKDATADKPGHGTGRQP